MLRVADGWPPAYARAAGTDGPAVVLTFRSAGPELEALGHAGPPFFRPPWRRDEVGLLLADDTAGTDWAEVRELLVESYRVLAPRMLAERITGPGPPAPGSG